jgi:hypothetical protein
MNSLLVLEKRVYVLVERCGGVGVCLYCRDDG